MNITSLLLLPIFLASVGCASTHTITFTAKEDFEFEPRTQVAALAVDQLVNSPLLKADSCVIELQKPVVNDFGLVLTKGTSFSRTLTSEEVANGELEILDSDSQISVNIGQLPFEKISCDFNSSNSTISKSGSKTISKKMLVDVLKRNFDITFSTMK